MLDDLKYILIIEIYCLLFGKTEKRILVFEVDLDLKNQRFRNLALESIRLDKLILNYNSFAFNKIYRDLYI